MTVMMIKRETMNCIAYGTIKFTYNKLSGESFGHQCDEGDTVIEIRSPTVDNRIDDKNLNWSLDLRDCNYLMAVSPPNLKEKCTATVVICYGLMAVHPQVFGKDCPIKRSTA
ncbi:hypothetical protein LOAG_03288 [Loa loa]|uniref:Uncharacterized protein n=1 Tax=Loa loa TaxID=7209 RepID=A0A1S0U4U7_LOALO|nr:hypothetical protein LOAG_03288 [Loa loa]EFO25197.1 hypothetical protein LOAG_03288 [Loa loa]